MSAGIDTMCQALFMFFSLSFQANCECLCQLQIDCESLDVLKDLKALCVFDTITALIRSLEFYSHGSAALHIDSGQTLLPDCLSVCGQKCTEMSCFNMGLKGMSVSMSNYLFRLMSCSSVMEVSVCCRTSPPDHD